MIAAMEQILRTEAKARQKADQLQLTLENMSQGIMLVTKDLKIPIINSRCAEFSASERIYQVAAALRRTRRLSGARELRHEP